MQTARALGHAHSQGVVHRDVKPSNLLLDALGNIWVTDFGLAKSADDGLTQTGDIVGTLRYMAPERFRGWADPRSDVYSMGVTLHEMFTLRAAFTASDRPRLMQQIIEVGPPRPRSIDARIPNDLETIILKSIDREPARRYQSADELADDLERFLDHKPIHARRSTHFERVRRWCRRNPLTSSLLGVIATLVIVALIGLSFLVAEYSQLAVKRGELATKERAAHAGTQKAQKKAEESQRAATRNLIRLNVAAGLQSESQRNPLAALVRHAEALRLTKEQQWNETPHRIRLAGLLQTSPTLSTVWIPAVGPEGEPVSANDRYVKLSPTGTSVVTVPSRLPKLRALSTELWDTRTGPPCRNTRRRGRCSVSGKIPS